MKKTIVGDGHKDTDVEGETEDVSKQNQEEIIDSKTDESRTNKICDESIDSKSTIRNPDQTDQEKSQRGDENRTEEPSNDCKETNKLKSVKEDKEKGNLEVENLSPEPERRSSRLRGKRPKLTDIITTSDEEEFENDDDAFDRKEKNRKKGKKSILAKYMQKTRPRGKQKKISDSEPKKKDAVKESKTSKKSEEPAIKPPKEFSSGAYVVLKADFHSTMTPPIWKIDGKALLQKYTHFDKDGQTLYKNTSTYSGWTPNNKDQYYPATVELKLQNRQETIVRFNREAINAEESD